jgi:hypothetical protein
MGITYEVDASAGLVLEHWRGGVSTPGTSAITWR